jgi:hypothetical protein
MAVTNPGIPSGNGVTAIRTGIAATDNATINDTNYPPASATLCKGWRSVLISARGVGGALTTVSVQALYRLGSEWVLGPTATVLGSDGASATFDTMGRLCFFRVTSLTLGAATTVTLNCAGWEPLLLESPRFAT